MIRKDGDSVVWSDRIETALCDKTGWEKCCELMQDGNRVEW